MGFVFFKEETALPKALSGLIEVWRNSQSRSDRWGIVISVLCCIHCLLTPLIFFMVPLAAGYYSHHLLHFMVLLVVIPLALWAFVRHYKRHQQKTPGLLALAGIALLLSGVVLESVSSLQVHWDAFITFAGGLLLVVGHWMNIQKTLHVHGCHHCHEPQHIAIQDSAIQD